ncbi:hypothetical protein ABK040_005620 [Willaertia magna]
MNVNLIEPEELKERIIKQDTLFHIVDVRDDDYEEGKIKTPNGTIQYHHAPFYQFSEQKALELLKQLLIVKEEENNSDKSLSSSITNSSEEQQKVIDVIFHCYYSQQRGPKAAYRFYQVLREQDENVQKLIRVNILRGGWGLWRTRFFKNNELIEELTFSEEDYTSSSSSGSDRE